MAALVHPARIDDLTCAYCDNAIELDDLEVEQDDIVVCDVCSKENVLWNGRLVTVDEAHEARCDSLASRAYEVAAYGRRDDD